MTVGRKPSAAKFFLDDTDEAPSGEKSAGRAVGGRPAATCVVFFSGGSGRLCPSPVEKKTPAELFVLAQTHNHMQDLGAFRLDTVST